MCDVMTPEEVFEDCQSSSEEELYEDAEDYFCTVKSQISPAEFLPTPAGDFSGPAKDRSSAVEGRLSPAEDHPSPAEDRSSPAEDRRSSPAEDRSRPAEDHHNPAEDRSSPAEDHPSPAEDHPSPAEDGSSPVEDHPSPAEDGSSPVEDHPSPAENRSSPAEDRSSPAEDHPSPAEDGSRPAEDRSSPAEDQLSPEEDCSSPADDRPSPAEDSSSSAEDLSSPVGVRDSPAEDRTSPVDDRPTLDKDGSSPSVSAAGADFPVTSATGEPLAAGPAAPSVVAGGDQRQGVTSEVSQLTSTTPAGEAALVDAGKDFSVCDTPETETVTAAAVANATVTPSCDLGGAGDWDGSEGDEQPRRSLSSEGDSSESSSAPEASWHVLEPSDPTAVPVASPAAAAVAAGSATTAAATDNLPACPVDEAAPRPAGPAPDIAQLADAVSDSVPAPASDSDPSPDASAAGDTPAAAAARRDSDDDAELVTDPDAVDEEALRQLDEAETEEEREDRRQRALQLKTDGNQLYASAAYDAARERYTAALRLCPLSAARERAVLLSNRAACRAKADDEVGAVADCSRSLELDPQYARPLQRRAELHEKAERLDEALDDWKRLLELRPDCGEARRAVARLPPLIAERNERLKSEMLGKLKDLGNMFMRPFGLSTDNFELEQTESGGYSVKFKQT